MNVSEQGCTSQILVDDQRVRVTRFDFEPGQETGWHVHALDYVIVPLSDCTMQLHEPGGNVRTVQIPKGQSYRRDAGVEHNVVNGGDSSMSFIEVELK